ncbi:hypothetical protein CPAV1605_183 [seawater metagenome]|uniref:Uncharacterized protein n=1 Tax=seawater metagenome TaxID=1561972 RepID=A0A5E8CGZ8_9ZZZZ
MYLICLTSNKYGGGKNYFHLKECRLIPYYITDTLANAIKIAKENQKLTYILDVKKEVKISSQNIIYQVENNTIEKCNTIPNCFLIEENKLKNIENTYEYDSDDSEMSGFLFD